MSWKNDLNNVKKIFQNGTTKEKFEYIFDYYKWHILVIILVIYFIANMIYTNLTTKEYVLQGIFLNMFSESNTLTDLEQDFLNDYPINDDSEDIFFDSSLYYLPNTNSSNSTASYETLQLLTVRIATGEIDFIIGDLATIADLSYNQYFSNLVEVLSEEQIKAYESYFLYYDKAVLEKWDSIDYTSENISEMYIPDPTRPELMEEPVPVMINISVNDKLTEIYPETPTNYAIGIVANGPNKENTLEFLDYLIQ